MRFNHALAASLLILGALAPAHAETSKLPENASAAELAYLEAASACVTPDLPPINAVQFPSPDPELDQPQPAAATSPAPAPVPACP